MTTGTVCEPTFKMLKFNLSLLLLVSSAISMKLQEPEQEEQVIYQLIYMVESGLNGVAE